MTEIMPVENTGPMAIQTNTIAPGIMPLPIEQIDLIHDAETLPFDLMSDYWSPAQVGEVRNVLFDRIQDMDVPDQNTGEVIELPCAFFFWQEKKGQPIKSIRNGSKRLVGALQAWNLPRLAPLEIRYDGKVKNKNNGNYSDSWSVKPKSINVTPKQ
jgi:hypothetical protein